MLLEKGDKDRTKRGCRHVEDKNDGKQDKNRQTTRKRQDKVRQKIQKKQDKRLGRKHDKDGGQGKDREDGEKR